jgi:hypothetical protein
VVVVGEEENNMEAKAVPFTNDTNGAMKRKYKLCVL